MYSSHQASLQDEGSRKKSFKIEMMNLTRRNVKNWTFYISWVNKICWVSAAAGSLWVALSLGHQLLLTSACHIISLSHGCAECPQKHFLNDGRTRFGETPMLTNVGWIECINGELKVRTTKDDNISDIDRDNDRQWWQTDRGRQCR